MQLTPTEFTSGSPWHKSSALGTHLLLNVHQSHGKRLLAHLNYVIVLKRFFDKNATRFQTKIQFASF